MAKAVMRLVLDVESEDRVGEGLLEEMVTAGIDAVSDHIDFEYEVAVTVEDITTTILDN